MCNDLLRAYCELSVVPALAPQRDAAAWRVQGRRDGGGGMRRASGEGRAGCGGGRSRGLVASRNQGARSVERPWSLGQVDRASIEQTIEAEVAGP